MYLFSLTLQREEVPGHPPGISAFIIPKHKKPLYGAFYQTRKEQECGHDLKKMSQPVSRVMSMGDHLSRPLVTRGLKRPT